MFSATLRRIQLADSTAYDMIARHRVRIGEMRDPDTPDPRDEPEESSPTIAGAGPEEKDNLPEPKPELPPPAPRVVLVLKGALAIALAEIRSFDQCPDNKAAITECVFRVWREATLTASSVHEARTYCSRLVARLPEEEKKANPLLVAFANAAPSATLCDVVRIVFHRLVRSCPREEQEGIAEIIAETAKDELEAIRELNRQPASLATTSEPVPSEPETNNETPSEPTPAPIKHRRRSSLGENLPQPNDDRKQVRGEVVNESAAA
jgi:hypothetical protein